MERAASSAPLVHLFDEPQFNTQDGYIGFMLDFFRGLRAEGRLVFLCLHPNEPLAPRDPARDLRALRLRRARPADPRRRRSPTLERDARVRAYLGRLAAPASA